MRAPQVYLVRNIVNPGYEWVFDDPDTFCCEKIDGQNIKIQTRDGHIKAVQNRKNIVHYTQVIKKDHRVLEGIVSSIGKGYLDPNAIQAGELIGPKLQGNPYQLDHHLWYPFSKAVSSLRYKAFDKHGRTLEGWSLWFEKYIFSLFMQKRGIKDVFPEGIVIYNMKRKLQGQIYMAKLRRDMFDWYYDGVEIFDYTKDY